MFQIPLEIVAFIALACGIIGRTYFPYLRKTEQNGITEPITFSARFIITAIFSGIVSAIFVFPLFVLPENATTLSVFISGFIFSWGANDVTNRIAHSTPATGTTDSATTALTVDTSPASALKFAPEKP